MESKDRALKTALFTVVIVAAVMVAYYWWKGRNARTENDLGAGEKQEAPAGEAPTAGGAAHRGEFGGIYSATEPLEGNGRRFGFFSVNPQDDGSYSGTAKVEQIAAGDSAVSFLKCPEAKLSEKEFFIKCLDADLGQISFVGERGKSGDSVQVQGKFLWAKDGAVVFEKTTSLSFSSGY